jgi:hypothetical protein
MPARVVDEFIVNRNRQAVALPGCSGRCAVTMSPAF